MKRYAIALLAAILLPSAAAAQSAPNWSRGYVPSAGEINNAFAKKQDKLPYTPLSQSGGTMTGKLQAAPATVNGAGLSILPGVAPSSPSNGDLWSTGVGLFGRFANRTLAIPGMDQSTGALSVPNGPTLGTYQNGQFTSQPYNIQIQGPGSTGPVGGTSATPTGGAASRLLADWLASTHFNVSTVAALRAWPTAPLIAGASVRTSGYYTAGDGGGAEYVWTAGSTATDDGCMIFAPTSNPGSGRWLRQIPNGSDLSVLTCGVKADYNFGASSGTDNTVALQNTINVAQTVAPLSQGYRITVPPGGILTGPVTVSGQLDMVGSSSAASVFVLATSATTAAFSIKTTGADYTAQGFPPAAIQFSKIRVTGQAGKAGNAGAHGFDFPSGGTIPAWVRLTDVTAYNLGGSGVHANGFSGFAEFSRSVFSNNGQYGSDTGSTADWRFFNCDWGANTAGNFRSQFDVQMALYNPNVSGAGAYGMEVNQSDLKISGGSVDLNNKSGIKYTANPNGFYRLVLAGGFSFGGNSRTAANTYYDIEAYGSGSGLLLSGVRFSHKPYVQDNTSYVVNNIYIDPSSTLPITENSNQFAGGSLVSPGVTNAPNRFGAAFTTYTPSMVASGATTFVSGATSGRYQIVGKRLDFSMSGTITTSGNGTTWVAIALPGTLKPVAGGTIAGFASNGKLLSGQMIAGNGFVFFRNADGTYPGADGLTITASGSVEIQ